MTNLILDSGSNQSALYRITKRIMVNISDLLETGAVYGFDEIRGRANKLLMAD
jgi:regulator of RNase E activity RraB